MAGLTTFAIFFSFLLFGFLGAKATDLHEKYFGEDSVNPMTYPLLFCILWVSILVELAYRIGQ